MINLNLFYILSMLLVIFSLIIIIGKKYNDVDWGHPVANVLDGWFRLYCKKFHRLGNQHFKAPKDQKLILVANHLSAIDPFILIAATDRPIRFMIAKEEYQKPVLNWMFKVAGCIPVDRGGRVDGAFRSAIRAVNAGELVALFPQGGIHSEETPRAKIKLGIIRLCKMSNSSILPVRIRGISAPGTMIACLYKRSRIELDVEDLVPPDLVAKSEFRNEISDWFIEKRKSLF